MILDFYDAQGNAFAYSEDGESVYSFDGKPIGYFHGEHFYDFSGRHRGFFSRGHLWDHAGTALLYTPAATGGPMKPSRSLKPEKASKGLKPFKGVREMAPLKPLLTVEWSRVSVRTYFLN